MENRGKEILARRGFFCIHVERGNAGSRFFFWYCKQAFRCRALLSFSCRPVESQHGTQVDNHHRPSKVSKLLNDRLNQAEIFANDYAA